MAVTFLFTLKVSLLLSFNLWHEFRLNFSKNGRETRAKTRGENAVTAESGYFVCVCFSFSYSSLPFSTCGRQSLLKVFVRLRAQHISGTLYHLIITPKLRYIHFIKHNVRLSIKYFALSVKYQLLFESLCYFIVYYNFKIYS